MSLKKIRKFLKGKIIDFLSETIINRKTKNVDLVEIIIHSQKLFYLDEMCSFLP